jgi:nucleoid-associated protein YgaU
MKRTRIKITNPKRFSRFVLLCTLMAAGLVSAFGLASSAVANNAPLEIVYTVRTGDTLWDIARENNPQNKNLSRRIDEIMEYNDLRTASIRPCDTIRIPMK